MKHLKESEKVLQEKKNIQTYLAYNILQNIKEHRKKEKLFLYKEHTKMI